MNRRFTTIQFKVTYQVFICILKIFGLFPFGYNCVERRYFESKVLYAYSGILLGIYIYFVGSFKWNIVKNMSMESSQYNIFLMASALVLVYVGVVVTSLVALFFSSNFLVLFNDLRRLWYKMKVLSTIPSILDRKLLTRFFVKIFIIDGGYFLGIAYANSRQLFGHADVNEQTVLYDTLYNLHNFAANATFTNLFVAISYLGAHYYRLINVRIRNVHQKLEKVSNDNTAKKRLVFSRIARELHQLAQWHGQVNQLILSFMDLHGASLSAMVLKNFMILLGSLFGAYVTTVVQLSMGLPVQGGLVAFHLLMVSFYFVQYYYLVASAAIFTKRAEKSGTILDSLARIDESGGHLEDLIATFSLELLHRNNKIENNGMFIVDYSLIYAALASILGYLIIAVQFQITDVT
ncbi:uncharacterized protein LOC119770775 [Culex quinquefasciatus]|uniref:Gustatory receptor n=1 Tax=Culex quinquefasciatus TaxID=7176 RepID=A0A1S4KIE2_CULQU|nr:uncharacterized protein LOC119770775 [Culex quinquefasciatus]